MPSSFYLRLFGPPALMHHRRGELRFRTRKQVALLAYLVLEGRDRALPREELADLLWPTVPAHLGRHSLSQGLSAMRERLGPHVVNRGGRTVRLLGAVASELEVLTDGGHIEGTDLDRPLLGLEDVGGAAFGHWVDRTRERLRRAAREALASELLAARARGDVNRVYERAAQLYRVDPMSDTAVRALSERMLLDGDTAGTVRLLRSHVARLKEAGVEADAGLHRFLKLVEHGLVRVQRVDLTAPKAAQVRRPEIFVGRETEMSRLESLWGRAVVGKLTTCLIAGPGGIGKSSLLKRFSTSMASRSAAVWEVACQEIGRNIPFAFVSELFHALGRDPTVGATDPRWLAEASRVTPGLRALYPGVPEPPPTPVEAIRLRLAEALLRMIEVIADGEPILLAMDDIAYLDPASRDILYLLFRRLATSPVLVLASARTIEEHRLTAVEDGFDTGFHWDDVLKLSPLAAEPARAIVTGLANATTPPSPVPHDVVEAMVELAQGNPYLIEMLVSDWRRDPQASLVAAHVRGDSASAQWHPPATMRQAFDRQYRGVSPVAERLLNLLAVAGRTMPAAEVGRLLDLSAAETDAAVLELLDRGVLRMEDGGLRFKNQLHRAFVYFAMSEGRKRYLHDHFGSYLARFDSQEFQLLLEASYHMLKGGTAERAVMTVLKGAPVAIARGAAKEAEKALRQVLKSSGEKEQRRLQVLLAEAMALQGRHAEVIALLSQIDSSALIGEPRATLTLLHAESLHRGCLADDQMVESCVEQAISDAEAVRSESLQLRALQLAAEFRSELGRSHSLKFLRKRASLTALRTQDPQAGTLALLTIAYCDLVSGDTLGARVNFERCLTVQGSEIRDYERRRALAGIAMCRVCLGEYAEALGLLAQVTEIAERCGDLDGAANAWSNRGVIHDDLGDFESAALCFERAVRHGSLAGSHRRLAEIAINAAGSAISLRRPTVAASLVSEATILVQLAGQWRLAVDLLYVRADLELLVGNDEDACKLIVEAQRVRQGRLYPFADVGRLERLDRFLAWRTGGCAAMEDAASIEVFQQVGDRIEVDLFRDFVAERENSGNGKLSDADALVDRLGLHGVVTRLHALNMCRAKDDAAVDSGSVGVSHCRAIDRLMNVARLMRGNRKETDASY